jgi:hypothetical protein
MTQYAVIHGVCGIWEGYSETDCEFFPNRGFAEKHALQLLKDFEQDSMVLQIDHPEDDTWYYHMDTEGDGDLETATQCIITIIELDMSNRSDSTESVWLTWNQLDNCQAWDYHPLCMSLVTRVASDVMDTTSDDYPTQALHNLAQLGEFISAVYYRNHAIIDIDDYVMHAFRIPKPKNSDSYDEETTA